MTKKQDKPIRKDDLKKVGGGVPPPNFRPDPGQKLDPQLHKVAAGTTQPPNAPTIPGARSGQVGRADLGNVAAGQTPGPSLDTRGPSRPSTPVPPRPLVPQDMGDITAGTTEPPNNPSTPGARGGRVSRTDLGDVAAGQTPGPGLDTRGPSRPSTPVPPRPLVPQDMGGISAGTTQPPNTPSIPGPRSGQVGRGDLRSVTAGAAGPGASFGSGTPPHTADEPAGQAAIARQDLGNVSAGAAQTPSIKVKVNDPEFTPRGNKNTGTSP